MQKRFALNVNVDFGFWILDFGLVYSGNLLAAPYVV